MISSSSIIVRHEVKVLTGDIDCVIETPDFVYVLEFKVGKSVYDALKQIIDKDYAGPYKGSGREIFRIGVNFTKEPRDCEYKVLYKDSIEPQN